jgi:hypothetical protein
MELWCSEGVKESLVRRVSYIASHAFTQAVRGKVGAGPSILIFRLYQHRHVDESSGDAERHDLSCQSSLNRSSSLQDITDVEKAQNSLR